jgi:hypothetical protein
MRRAAEENSVTHGSSRALERSTESGAGLWSFCEAPPAEELGRSVRVVLTYVDPLSESAEPCEIDLCAFVGVWEIVRQIGEPLCALAPLPEFDEPYRLLAEVMERKDRAGLASAMVGGVERVVAVIARNGLLHVLRLRSRLACRVRAAPAPSRRLRRRA